MHRVNAYYDRYYIYWSSIHLENPIFIPCSSLDPCPCWVLRMEAPLYFVFWTWDNWILHNGQTNQWLSTMSSSIFLLFLFGAPVIINQSAVSISWHWICGVCWRCCALPRAITYMWSIRPWNHAWQIPLFTTSGLRTLTHRGRYRPRASMLAHSQWWAPRDGCEAATWWTLL